MKTNNTIIKGTVNLTQIQHIKTFAELGATKKLFECFWAGQYVRIINTALDEYEHAFPFEKSIKIGATSWLTGRYLENTAHLIYALYKEFRPDNSDLTMMIEPNDLSLVTIAYNIKYPSNSPLIVTKVHSLLTGLVKKKNCSDTTVIAKQEGISLHKCICDNTFIARCSTATATCQWCRSKIKKLTYVKHIDHVSNNKSIHIEAIARMCPAPKK